MALMVALTSGAACSSGTSSDPGSSGSTGSSVEGTATPASIPASLTLTEADDRGSFEVQAGGIIKLSLRTNPSTGYAWEMDDPDPEASLLEQVGVPSFVSDDPGAVGAGGIMIFKFRAVDRGQMVLRLAYYPPDATEDPTNGFQVDLTVR
jgi:inhibitor of cysteine peptidase